MAQGTIKKVIADKGFGFIEGERGDLFFHHSAVEGTTIESADRAAGQLRRRKRPQGSSRRERQAGVTSALRSSSTVHEIAPPGRAVTGPAGREFLSGTSGVRPSRLHRAG